MSNETTPSEAFAEILESKFMRISTNVLAQVTEWHPETNTVDVQPCLQRLKQGQDSPNNLPIITGVPVQFVGAGDWWITFTPVVDSYCMLQISERSLDVWKHSGGVVNPDAKRHHNMADAVAVFGPNPFSDAIGDIDTGMTIRNRSGTVKMTFTDEAIICNVPIIAPDFENDDGVSFNDHTHTIEATVPAVEGVVPPVVESKPPTE